MLPPPEEGLQVLGSTIRAARKARGLTQQRTAREADVSRAQLALLEKGENVSVKFILKIARFLDLREIPLDGSVRFTAGRGATNVLELIDSADLLIALAEHLRAFAIDAIMPASGRPSLKDTPAVREFLERHGTEADAFARLSDAVLRLSHESRTAAPSPEADASAPAPRVRRRRKAGA